MKKVFLLLLLFALPAAAELTRFDSGNPADVKPGILRGPVLILSGGGGDYDEAMQTAIDRVRGCTLDCRVKIDVVVLRASGAEGYNEYFMGLNGVDSVVTFVITDRDSAMRDDVAQTVREAELVFFAGGDQCNYVKWIKGTKVADAVKAVYKKKGAVGGTSAGLAIQGEYIYDACPDQSAKSADVLNDPFSIDVSVSTDFFEWPAMRNVITDTHFQQRDRLGRLLVFMARAWRGKPLLGLGISEGTVALVDKTGAGIVMGKGPVHLIALDAAPSVVKKGTPLEAKNYKVWRFEKGETFDLHVRPLRPAKLVDVVSGKVSDDPY